MVLNTNFQTYSTKIEVPTEQNVVWPTIMAQTLVFNPKKSAVMFIRSDYMLNIRMPVFKINDENI